LRDGNVFEAYEQFPTGIPIIFATAYDAFWMKAFENSGIAYLLKPYTFESFHKAFNKYLKLKHILNTPQNDFFNNLNNLLKGQPEALPAYKDFIAVKSGTAIYFLQVADIVVITADSGVAYAYDCHHKKHLLNQNS
jgi:DNA-binding LytR/AlgR family response regulator